MLRFIKKHRKTFIRLWLLFAITGILCVMSAGSAYAAEAETGSNNLISIGISTGDGSDMASVLQMVLVLTILALAPSILIMVTSFTRIVIVMHFTRAAIGTQTVPPNQIIIGLSLFLTFFVMAPTFSRVYTEAIQPLSNNEITAEEAYDIGVVPVREFMLSQVSTKDLQTFLELDGTEQGSIESEDDIPLHVLVPSFIISELRTAFIIGFLIYMPFIVIDMVVASTLMSMGMMMLPPTVISMPFKILLFVMADGWNLVIGNLIKTFY